MNDETRAALDWRDDDELRKLRESILIDIDNAYQHGQKDTYGFEATRYADRLMVEVTRLLAQRTPVAEDAHIEAVARAIFSADISFVWQLQSDEERDRYRDIARAAIGAIMGTDHVIMSQERYNELQAAAPVSDIDAMLDSVHPEAMISFVFQHDSEPWIAGVRWPYTDELPIDSQTFVSAEGTGPTRTAAIADAVAKVKEATP